MAPILRPAFRSFVGILPIPILHGCTIGELALMINGEGWINKTPDACRLTVIPMTGWEHGQPYSLPIKPSPNLPNDQAIRLYASLCPFEATRISVGAGVQPSHFRCSVHRIKSMVTLHSLRIHYPVLTRIPCTKTNCVMEKI